MAPGAGAALRSAADVVEKASAFSFEICLLIHGKQSNIFLFNALKVAALLLC